MVVMSDLIKHVLIGEVIGESLYRVNNSFFNNRFTAFTAGLSSQIIMDYLDNEFVVNWFNLKAFNTQALFYLFFETFITLFIIYHIYQKKSKNPPLFQLKLFAISGAVVPDIIDAGYALIKPQAWYNGDLIFFWHRSKEVLPMQTIGATVAISFSLFFFRFYIYPFLSEVNFLTRYSKKDNNST